MPTATPRRLWLPLLQVAADFFAMMTGIEKPFGLSEDATLTETHAADAASERAD